MDGAATPTRTAQPGSGDTVPGGDLWRLVAGAALLIFLAQFDAFVVTAALPTMQADLGFSTGAAQWVMLGFLLPMIAISLPAGRWLDRVGARPALVLAVTGFALSSGAAGLAPGLGWLISARALQGAFAALMIAQAFTLATTAVQPSARGRSMAIVSTVGALGAVSGPTAGGYLTQAWGWPWIFFVNVPVCVLLVVMSWTQAPADRPLRAPSRDALWETATLGAAAAVIVLALFLSAGHGLGWLALAVLALPFLALWTRLPASGTVIALIRRPGMISLHVAMLTVFASFLLVMFLAPFYLQRVLHASVATIGLTLLALPAAQMALGPIGGILTDRWGARPTAITGLTTLIAGTATLLPLDQDWTPSELAWRSWAPASGSPSERPRPWRCRIHPSSCWPPRPRRSTSPASSASRLGPHWQPCSGPLADTAPVGCALQWGSQSDWGWRHSRQSSSLARKGEPPQHDYPVR